MMMGARPKGAGAVPQAGAGAPSGVDGNGPKPFSVQRKVAIVARLLRGEPLELVAGRPKTSTRRRRSLFRSPRWPAGLMPGSIHN